MIMDQVELHIQSEASTASARSETFGGREYLVVPVIALVEGVLHSANAENPELALATEFGRYPSAWDGRPLVMNHPKVDGDYVSANSPKVLEDWAFGYMFNTRLDGLKLKSEAWIDIERVNTMGGEALDTLTRIQEGKMVEVSTGLFASVETLEGTYADLEYKGVWRSITPDHLAFLSEGLIGACSIEAGCGVPRLNMRRVSTMKTNAKDCGCGCGGTGTCGGTQMADATTTTETKTGVETPATEVTTNQTSDEARALSALFANSLKTNSYPADMTADTVSNLLRGAVRATVTGDDWAWVYTFTQNHVIYSLESSETTGYFRRSYTISTDGQVTLGDDMTEVVQKVIFEPVGSEAPAQPIVSGDAINQPEEDPSMSGTQTQGEPAATQTPAVNSAPVSVEDYIKAAPAEIQEMLTNGLKLHADKRANLTKTIRGNSRNTFSEEALGKMDLATLEGLAALADAPVANYAGQAPRTNAAGGDNDETVVPRPLEAFPRKTAAA